MKCIAWLINLYPPYVVGGNEMLARDIVVALRTRGHDVQVLTAKGRQLDGVPGVHQVLNYSLDDDKETLFQGGRALSPAEQVHHHAFDLTTYRNVRHALQRLEPDLIVVNNLYMASAAPLLAVRGARCPVVAQVADRWLIYLLRDLTLLLHPGSRWQGWLLQAYRRFIQPVLWRLGQPDEIVTISAYIKKLYVQAGFPAAHISPMHLGVDMALYQPRQQPHTQDNHLEVIFAGQLWQGKGPQVLVEALGRLRAREPSLELTLRLIGEGNERFKEYLRGETRRHGIEDRTTFDGFLPLSRLAERLRNGDIFAFPSTWDEPFSITLVAAMASGIPVIATNTGGTPETFEDGVEGILIPAGDPEALADALLRLARDPEQRNRLAQAAVETARQRWSFDAYVDRLERHYLSIARQKGKAG